MGKPSAPPPPDYTPIAMAAQSQQQASEGQLALAGKALDVQTAQADKDYGLQQDALDWAKSAYAGDKATNDNIISRQLDIQDASAANAAKAQGRYENVYQPLEDQAVNEAETYASPDRKAAMMGAASAGVAENFESQRIAAAQNLESFGIDPSSTRYAAMDAGIRANKAAAMAGAANTTGQQVDATARGLQANAINVGRGLPSDINAGNSTAINAGQSGANIGLATTASGANTMGTGLQYGALGTGAAGAGIGAINAGNGAINAGTNAISAWGNTINNGYSNQIDAYKASQSGSSGIGSILGAAAGFIPGLADGGTVPGDEAVALNPGSAVPASASPSGGRAVDDVSARLTPGEFVLPKDFVQWKGEEYLQKQITKAREDRAKNSPAKPRAIVAPPQPAAYTSRAIPV